MGSDEGAPVPLSESAWSKRELLVRMRNELQSPLDAIIGYSEMLLEDAATSGPEEGLADFEKIHSAGQRLLALINDLLDPARSAAERSDSDRARLGAALRHELRTPLNAIIGYSEMLLEDGAGGGREEVVRGLQQILTSGKKLLAFIDEVVAISHPEADGHAFSPEEAGEFGMIRDVMSAIRPAREAGADAPQGERGLLLVVDDNEVNRDILSQRLTRQGHDVVLAEDGARALQMIRTQKFDLVLLDIMMPEMNGYQVLEHLKADGRLHDLPVIMISALDEIDSVVRCIELGAEDYLPKPFNPVILRARIGACLEKKRLREERLAQQRAEEERLRSELEMAARVQRRLLPERPPEVAGLELASVCLPARWVGGDYYDFLALERGRVGIAVADVAGKGMPAALLMSTIEASLRSQVRAADCSLSELVSAMNELLHSWTGASSYATFFYAQFDRAERSLTYVNAGHNPPMLLRPGGAAGLSAQVGADAQWGKIEPGECLMSLLTTGGPVIGAFAGLTFEQETVRVQSGDVLVAYTDGVTEALNLEGEEFGEARLQSIISADLHLRAGELVESVVTNVREWCRGAPQYDDLTLVVMKVT